MKVRRMARPIAAALMIAGLFGIPAHAQSITRVFELSHVEPIQLASTLSLFDAQVQANNNLRTLTVRADATVMPAIEDVVSRLDILRVERAAEVTAYVLRASDLGGTSVPASLDVVVEQLRNVFAYSGYELMDTLVVRGVDGGEPSVQGTISLDVTGIPNRPVFYNFSGEFRVIEPDEGPDALRIGHMSFGFRIPIVSSTGPDTEQFQYIDTGINTDVEIPEGSQIVVGKATVGDSALILVMTVEFLN